MPEGFTTFPETICLTGNSTFFRLTVVCLCQLCSRIYQICSETHRYLWCLEDELGHMPPRAFLRYPIFDPLDQVLTELLPGFHQQEHHHAFVGIGRSPLTHADAVLDFIAEERLDDRIYLCGSETYAGRIEDSICAPKEVDAASLRVDVNEIAMRPDI